MTEIFKDLTNGYKVGSLGSVILNGEKVEEFYNAPYKYVIIDGKQERVHQLVGKCFPEICGEWKDKYHIHHLNRDQLDNRAINLLCLSPREHRRLHTEEDGIVVSVVAYNQNKNKVGEWRSIYEASIDTGIDYRHINNIINEREYRYTAGGYYWFKNIYSEDAIFNKIDDIIKNKYKRN